MFNCYVALGDSLTECYGDEYPGIPKTSWGELISKELNIPNFYNLGKSGLRSDEILQTQFPISKKIKPDLVSITAGGNDLIQRKWNKKEYTKNLRLMIDYFTKNGATVMTCTLPDFTRYHKLPYYKKKFGKYYINQCNQVMAKLSKEYNTVHMDFYNHPIAFDMSNLSADCLHPNSKGYTSIANEYISLLKERMQ